MHRNLCYKCTHVIYIFAAENLPRMPATESPGRTNAVVLFSGGLDSTACVHLLQTNGFEVTGLFVDFGQPAAKAESRAVATLKKHLAIEVHSLRIGGFRDLKSGELFGRNLLLISAALFYSTGLKCVIGTGIHAGTAYYDCSQLVSIGSALPIRLGLH
jgi:7-cyano-7-deazaguanine synthase in queuosine biosynthesis